MERKRWAVANGAALGEERYMRRLSPLQRAYWLGYCRARQKMRRELDEIRRRLDDEIAELVDVTQDMRNEYYRLKAVEEAIDTERDVDTLLN